MWKKLNWIIEDVEEFDDLAEKLIQLNKNVKRIKFNPLLNLNIYKEDELVICHGGVHFISYMQSKSPLWIPHSYCDFKKFDFSYYSNYFYKYLLNKDFHLFPSKVFFDNLFKDYFNNIDKIFVKSNSGKKTFSGMSISKNDNLYIDSYDLRDEEIIVVSSYKEIEKEYRFVVCDKEIISGSLYKINGEFKFEKIENGEEWNFVQDVINDELIEEAYIQDIYTIDVCSSNGNLFVLEINSFSCAGLYDCDIKRISEFIEKKSMKEYQSFLEDLI